MQLDAASSHSPHRPRHDSDCVRASVSRRRVVHLVVFALFPSVSLVVPLALDLANRTSPRFRGFFDTISVKDR